MKIAYLACVLALGSAPATCGEAEGAKASAIEYAKNLGIDLAETDVTLDAGPVQLAEWLTANPRVLPKDHLNRVKRAIGSRPIRVVKFAPRVSPGEVFVGGSLWVFVEAATCKPLTHNGEK
jgi:hypothetical protein